MSVSSRNLPFPHNLSPAQRRSIEAVDRWGTIVAAAKAMGLADKTIGHQLMHARRRAGVETTDALVKLYRGAS